MQVAAAGIGVPVIQVKVEMARTDFPVSQGSGGSWGAPNTSVAIDRALLIMPPPPDDPQVFRAVLDLPAA